MRDPARLTDDQLGEVLARAATEAFPETPDLATVVQARLERETLAYPEAAPTRGWRVRDRLAWRPVRRSTALALLAILLVAALAAAVILGVPGIRINVVPSLPTLPPTAVVATPSAASPAPGSTAPLTPSPEPTPLGASLSVGTPVDIEAARAHVDFPVQLPSDPSVGAPDQAYVLTALNVRAVSFVWRPGPALPEATSGIGMLLTEFEGHLNTDQFQKILGPGTTLTVVRVGEATGYWLHGARHFFVTPVDNRGDWSEQQVRLAGDTLLWNVGDVTYRLEAAVDEKGAIRIGESLAP